MVDGWHGWALPTRIGKKSTTNDGPLDLCCFYCEKRCRPLVILSEAKNLRVFEILRFAQDDYKPIRNQYSVGPRPHFSGHAASMQQSVQWDRRKRSCILRSFAPLRTTRRPSPAETISLREAFPSDRWVACEFLPNVQKYWVLYFEEGASMKVVPVGANVVVKQLPVDEMTAGGLVLPDAAKEKPLQGRVLSVGDGRLLPDGSRARQQVNEGDRVLFSKYAGVEAFVNGEELLIMSENDILAVLL
jgi:chaperonin GroES